MTTPLVLLVIPPDENKILLKATTTGSTKAYEIITATITDSSNSTTLIDNLKGALTDLNEIKNIANSRFNICENYNAGDAKTYKCAIVKVTNDEQTKMSSGPYEFVTFFEGPTKKITASFSSDLITQRFFNVNFDYDKKDSKLEKCIKDTQRSSSIVLKEENKNNVRVAYTLFGLPYYVTDLVSPIITSIYGRYSSPYYRRHVSPIYFSPSIRSSSPNTRIGNFLTSSSNQDMFGPSIPRSSSGSSPKVPRLSPRGRGRRGGYYEKYLKYKNKYKELKAALDK
jgi:hypothetical protein